MAKTHRANRTNETLNDWRRDAQDRLEAREYAAEIVAATTRPWPMPAPADPRLRRGRTAFSSNGVQGWTLNAS